MTNVLLSSAGRRNYLVNYFLETLAGRGHVFVADASSEAPAMQEADRAFVVPLASDSNYIDAVLTICKNHNVKLLISLNDLELPILARNRHRFLEIGTIPVVSPPQVIDICFDKFATHDFLRKIGLKTPKTFVTLQEAKLALKAGGIAFPLVIKPRWGSASIGIDYLEEMAELDMAYHLSKIRLMRTFLGGVSSSNPDECILIQEQLRGKEFGLDIINDLNGQYVTTFVKLKLVMRAGETDRAITVEHETLKSIGKTIGESLGHIGNLDCDVFVDGENCYVLEMNPRIGGGYPFSHMGGANLPAALIAWAKNETPDLKWLAVQPLVASAKSDRLVKIKNPTAGSHITTEPIDFHPEILKSM